MRGLFIGLIVFLLIISGCVDGKYIGRKVDSSLSNEDKTAIKQEPRRDNPTEINDCVIIDEEGEYKLASDIESIDNEICINIQANNVILDCQEYTINRNIENIQEVSIGIRAFGNENDHLTRLTIKNCKITGWHKGIYLENVDSSKIINNIIVNAIGDSYKLEYPDNKFNMNDTAYDIDNKLTEEQLPVLLKNDVFVDDEGENRGETGYTQELMFTNRGSSESEKTIWYVYDHNTEDGAHKLMGDYIYLSKSNNADAWTYHFDLNSPVDVDNSADLKNTKFKMLGKQVIISNVGFTNGDVTELILLAGGITQIMATDDTFNGVTIVSVNVNDNRCVIEYAGGTYAINDGNIRTMPDGTIIGVTKIIASNEQETPDYCELNIGGDKVELEHEREVKVNGNRITRSKAMFEGNNGLDQFSISFKPEDKVFLKPGENYIDSMFGAFKLLFRRINEDNPEEIIISADEKVDLTATNKDGDTTTWAVAFAYNDGNRNIIIPGREIDEPFIALEGDFVTNTSMLENELSGMTGIRFLFSMNDISHIVKIKSIDTLNNKITFYDETTQTEYSDQEFTPETDSTFSFLPLDFKINFSRSAASGYPYDTIYFVDINDKGPAYFLKNGGNLTFWIKWSDQGQISTIYYITFGEADEERETNIPLNVIGVNLTYSAVNQEINLAAVASNVYFSHRTSALKQKDKLDTTLKAGKTIYGTYVEQITPTGAGTDSVTIKTPYTATYAEVWILSKNASVLMEGEKTGIKISNSNNNFIADNNVKGNDEGIKLLSSSSNDLVSNTLCHNNKDIKIEENSDNNEFLYNQFDTVEGLELQGMPCEIEQQEIQLNVGWNLISSYLTPYYTDIEAIFGPLARKGNLLMVKDENARFFTPDYEFNNIPEWNSQEAYNVKVKIPVTLTIRGEEHINTRIELHEGWNFIAYPLSESHDMDYIIENVLNPLGNNLNIIKNGKGKFYIPRSHFNNIDEMRPGEGYMINVYEDDVIDFGE